uniref:Integrase, catalytic region, zinc finger, CCHC-type, peptidase aspartic, catalytic n=1 Tax=Tanacetum cinerariifolium TaxID=118510 RepID=A0A699IDD9_TANCI|nr:integrase, catalytic region, zinc finger, CCHC-type, peptidase aspartic, catalytic [Tanacetum cinerariifolium]
MYHQSPGNSATTTMLDEKEVFGNGFYIEYLKNYGWFSKYMVVRFWKWVDEDGGEYLKNVAESGGGDGGLKGRLDPSKKPQVVPSRPRKPIRKANQFVATPTKKTVALDSTIQKSMSYYRMLYEKTNMKVAFKKSACYIRDLQGNNLLTSTRGSDLYTIALQESSSLTLICFLSKASPIQAWLWHRRLSHLNFDTINLLLKNDIVKG